MRASEVAALLGVALEGDDVELRGCAPIESARADEVSFVGNAKAAKAAAGSAAGCLIVGMDYVADRPVLRAADPRASFARAVALLHPARETASGIHPTAIIHPEATLGQGVTIGPYCVIGAGAAIGDDSVLFGNVTVYADCVIGPRARIHSGAVIGADGFGFQFSGDRYVKFPQVGRVEIGADVEIGANACVDRATLGVTRIGDGTKLDNLVHVGHNVTIGRHVVIAAQTGISGGAVIEDYAVIAGQVGIADKVRIETRAVLGAQCGVPTSKVIRAGQTVWGTPARPIKEYLEDLAQLGRVADLRRQVAELRGMVERLSPTTSPSE